MKNNPRLITATVCVIVVFSALATLSYFGCQVERVCMLSLNDGSNMEFDCDIIYSRLANYHSSNDDYVLGSMTNIEMTACSYEIVGILREQYNFGKNITDCHYYCCVTDGTCSGFPLRGVNIQQLTLEVGNG